MMHIDFFFFVPFADRPGEAVIGLRFVGNQALAETLEQVLAEQQAGGWLPHARCWWIEPAAWEGVRHAILDCNHRVMFGDLTPLDGVLKATPP